MNRLHGIFATAAIALIAAPCGLAAQSAAGADAPVMQVARLAHGSLNGVVRDERGDALEGVTVSAIGETMVFAVTDSNGRFNFESLPAGPYLLRAHRPGFAAAPREYVDIRPSTRAVRWIELRRLTIAPDNPEILAAGVMMVPTTGSEPATPDSAGNVNDADTAHPHTELAWRLRHARRSVLKDETIVAAIDDAPAPAPSTDFSSATGAFASLFGNLPFSGEINLLTAGSYDTPADLFGSGLPRGVTYVSIGPAGDVNSAWAVQAALSQGDVSSWVVAGSYAPRGPRTHALDVGLSYSSQQYVGGNPAALAIKSDGSRRVGNIRAFDTWTIAPGMRLTYGTHLSRYDYVSRDILWSPSAAVRIDLTPKTHVRTEFGQLMRAPGSEEFLLPSTAGLWLPPQRTFSMLRNGDYRVERARHVALSLEREFAANYVIAIRRFYERTDDQLVTIFGAGSIGGMRSDIGHYLLATAGTFDADGWAVSLSSPILNRIRGTVDYQLTRARWASPGAMALAVVAPSAVRSESEDVHDVATSVEADIAETGTRVFFFYRVSNAFARDDSFQLVPGLGGRFELQVKQGLGFMPFRGSEWQVLVGVRDLFADPTSGASLYDELLVVRPPKQVVGGVQVKF
jgi:hypothetical protein